MLHCIATHCDMQHAIVLEVLDFVSKVSQICHPGNKFSVSDERPRKFRKNIS